MRFQPGRFERGPKREIKLRIPDEDVVNWIQTLRENLFEPHEIDWIVGGANAEYAYHRFKGMIDGAVSQAEENFRKTFNRDPSPQETEKIRQFIIGAAQQSVQGINPDWLKKITTEFE